MESPSRIVLGIVAACVLLTLVVIFRSGDKEEEAAAPRPGSVTSNAAKARPLANRREGDSGSSSGEVERARPLGNSGFDPARPAAAPGAVKESEGKIDGGAAEGKGLEDAVSGGERNLAAEPVPQVQDLGGAVPAAAPPDAEALAAAIPGLPANASMAVSFDGSGAESLGSTVPLIEENVVYDLDEGAYFPPDARFAFGDMGQVKNEGGTIAFWMKPNWDGADGRNASLIQFRTEGWSNRLQVFKNGRYLRFLFTDNTGAETNAGVDMERDQWVAGEWHHIAATWGDALIALYADGALKDQQPYLGDMQVPTGTELYVGSDRPGGGPGADATLQDLVIVPEALDAAAVGDMFSQGR